MLITDREKMDAFLPHTRVWQGIPSIEKTKGGRLFATFYSGDVKENAGNYCVLLQSDDDGKTWIDPIAVAYINDDTDRCYDPCLWIDPLGRLWFTWAEHGTARRVMAAICPEPDADVLVWNTPIEIGGDVMMNKPIVLSSGEWLFPSAIWDPTLWVGPSQVVCANNAEKGSAVYMTKDQGKTFSRLGGADIPFRSFDEHMLLEKKDGTVEMYVRTRYGIGKSISYDRGRSWIEGIDSKLHGPSSRFHIRRLRSGNILLINHYAFTGRNNLTALLSDDDGASYRWHLLLDARNEVSYPDVTEDESGNIYVIYDRERGAFKSSLEEANACAREILMVKITEEDIKKGNTAAVSPVVISKLSPYSREDDPYRKESCMSDEAFIHSVVDLEDSNEILRRLFARYNTSCVNLHKVDIEALDGALTALVSGDSRIKTVEYIVSLLKQNGSGEASDGIFTRMIDYLKENLTVEFSLDDMAQALSASKFYLCHIFKERTGTTVYRYIRAQRLAMAKRLLAKTEKSVSDIAIECGFTDHSYFTKIFRASEGITPSEFRENYLKA